MKSFAFAQVWHQWCFWVQKGALKGCWQLYRALCTQPVLNFVNSFVDWSVQCWFLCAVQIVSLKLYWKGLVLIWDLTSYIFCCTFWCRWTAKCTEDENFRSFYFYFFLNFISFLFLFLKNFKHFNITVLLHWARLFFIFFYYSIISLYIFILLFN